jgi:starch synthase
LKEYTFEEYARFPVPTAMGPIETVIERVVDSPLVDQQISERLKILTIRYDPFFSRKGLYGDSGRDYPDNLERFSYFNRAVMELLLAVNRRSGWKPDVVHLHDWQAALCAVYLKTLYASYQVLAGIRSVLTLHNIGYQGIFPGTEYWKLGLPDGLFSTRSLEYYGSVNVLKGGIVHADFLTTVSPTYSHEIQKPEFGFGLEGVLSERKEFLRGIVNGIDTEVWNPGTDPFLASHYSVSRLKGKKQCKTHLQHEVKFDESDVLLIGVIARLTAQKGLDLLLEIAPELMESDLQLVVLGTGEPSYAEHLRALSGKYPDRVAFRDVFDESLAHRIEAGADLLLMPSRYEPCGLSQLYSLRYGTVPLVRKTGGLADTVVPYTPRNIKEKRATGFMFTDPTADALLCALMLAMVLYQKRKVWLTMVKTGMNLDNSWKQSAGAYVDLFKEMLAGNGGKMSGQFQGSL